MRAEAASDRDSEVGGGRNGRYATRRIINGVISRLKLTLQPIVQLPSRYLCGNLAGLQNNLLPMIQLFSYRKSLPRRQPLTSEADADFKLLHEFGFVELPRLFEGSELSEVVAKFRACLGDDQRSVRSPNGATKFVYNPLAQIPEVATLMRGRVVDLVTQYYGCSFRIRSVRAWRNHHVPNIDAARDDVYSNTFHNDQTPITGLRLFVLLSEGVTRDTGALRFHDKPTSRRLVRQPGFYSRWWQSALVRKSLVNPATVRYFEGNIGDACLVNTQQCLHAAGIPQDGSVRDILQFEIEPSPGSEVDIVRIFASVPRDEEIERMRRET
jgi:hypothetical protein